MADRDEILMNFQAISGIDDIPMCIDILEQKEWDLVAALKGVMPQDDYQCATSNGSTSTSNCTSEKSRAFVDLTATDGPIVIDAEEIVPPIQETDRDSCSLGVYFGEKLLRFEMPLDTTLAEFKQRLELDTNVPPSEQALSGWPEAMQVSKEFEDEKTLAQLGITGGIYHIRMDHQNPSHFPSLSHSHPHLCSQTLEEYGQLLPPPYSEVVWKKPAASDNQLGTSLLEVYDATAPSDVRSMSVDPGSMDDQLSSQESWDGVTFDGAAKKKAEGGGEIAGVGEYSGGGSSEKMEEVTTLDKDGVTVAKQSEVKEVVEILDSSDSSHYSDCEVVPGFGGEDDELYVDEVRNSPNLKAIREPLVPEDCTEPYEVLQYFTHSFELRYGIMHPLFLLGSLSEAVSEATIGTASSGTRKPMLVYLHHDGSVLTNVFCSQLLCSESVVNYLSLNFISWAWDLTQYVHRLELLKMVEECFGSTGKTQVNEIDESQLPVILIAFKEKGSISIKTVIQGNTSLDSLMTSLITTVDVHNLVLQREMQEEHDRMMREHMIAEQNRAYEESLLADKEKERKKREQKLEEEEKRHAKEAYRRSMSECVPEEPPLDSQDKTCTLRLRFPDGQVGQRRFLASHTLKDLINFVGSKDYLVSKYKILTGFPRKDLSEQADELSLEQLKLCPQETLIIEERTI